MHRYRYVYDPLKRRHRRRFKAPQSTPRVQSKPGGAATPSVRVVCLMQACAVAIPTCCSGAASGWARAPPPNDQTSHRLGVSARGLDCGPLSFHWLVGFGGKSKSNRLFYSFGVVGGGGARAHHTPLNGVPRRSSVLFYVHGFENPAPVLSTSYLCVVMFFVQ